MPVVEKKKFAKSCCIKSHPGATISASHAIYASTVQACIQPLLQVLAMFKSWISIMMGVWYYPALCLDAYKGFNNLSASEYPLTPGNIPLLQHPSLNWSQPIFSSNFDLNFSLIPLLIPLSNHHALKRSPTFIQIPPSLVATLIHWETSQQNLMIAPWNTIQHQPLHLHLFNQMLSFMSMYLLSVATAHHDHLLHLHPHQINQAQHAVVHLHPLQVVPLPPHLCHLQCQVIIQITKWMLMLHKHQMG